MVTDFFKCTWINNEKVVVDFADYVIDGVVTTGYKSYYIW